MTIGFALLLNNECHNFIRQIQLEIHREVGISLPRQTPHITIKSPFEVDATQDYVLYLEKVAKNLSPIDVECKGFGSFSEKVIYLDVMQNQEIVNLHWKLLNEMKVKFAVEPHELEGKNVKLHASIAGFSNRQSFQQASKYISRYEPKFSFTVEELGIFYHLGDGQGWIVNRRIRIGMR